MTLIEGIGDEVTHFFLGLLIVFIVSVAWWTTNISEQRHIRTVLLLERRQRNPSSARRTLTNHTQTVTISEGTTVSRTSSENNLTNQMEETPASVVNPTSIKPETSSNSTADPEEGERGSIIHAMDQDACVLRQRRLAFYHNWNSVNNGGTAPPPSDDEIPLSDSETPQPDSASTTHAQTDSLPEENLMEHNYAERQPMATHSQVGVEAETITTTTSATQVPLVIPDKDNIRIKLKFINDDLMHVTGNLEEKVGDFKRRHFREEIDSNKLVRLIFNGHVLHQDTQTLRGCGMFDDCVVHCLIHTRRAPNAAEVGATGRVQDDEAAGGPINGNLNNNQPRDWDLGSVLFGIITAVLLGAWYSRIELVLHF
ncbi:transmembrane and ubiquitin-like domain-containing protein 1 isoform X3 [Aethina tumida]|uniref:transmembrane and ubiquitin-like domain-containing protein 1 isoform X3 n=1 Tax=Aethina tumida TaxID=116153 RepID=UPI0021489EAA|nr:transmembrane and ubiquitin-like domain-containing protein 1 isoform X3 [Aethina tumida]